MRKKESGGGAVRRIIRRATSRFGVRLSATVGGSWRLKLPGGDSQRRSAHTTHTRTFCPAAARSHLQADYRTQIASAIRKNLYISQRNV